MHSYYSLIISSFSYMRRRHVCTPVPGRQEHQQHVRGHKCLYGGVVQHSSLLRTSSLHYSQELLTCTRTGWPRFPEQVVTFPDAVRFNPGEWLPVFISSFVSRAVKGTVGKWILYDTTALTIHPNGLPLRLRSWKALPPIMVSIWSHVKISPDWRPPP